MSKCKATLINNSDLMTLITAIRTSRDSMAVSDSVVIPDFKLGPNDKDLIQKCLKNAEGSVFEFVQYWFRLEMPRNVLQELSRHRVGVSPLVKSTRYTLDELFTTADVSKLLYSTEVEEVDDFNVKTLKRLVASFKNLYSAGVLTNDTVKHCIPEAYMTEGVYSINARALNHLFGLRNRPKVFKPFRELVVKMFQEIPEEHKFLFEHNFKELTK